MSTTMTEIIANLVGALTGISTGIGSSLSEMAESIFLGAEGALSTFGGLVTIFAGISLAFGLTRWVLNFITSLGERNR